MIRVAKYAAVAVASILVIAIGAPLLFWLGRSSQSHRGEFVVDDELLADDPGVDVDGDEYS